MPTFRDNWIFWVSPCGHQLTKIAVETDLGPKSTRWPQEGKDCICLTFGFMLSNQHAYLYI